MKFLNTTSSRRNFCRVSSLALGSIVLPKSSVVLGGAILGNSLSFRIRYKKKSLGVKFTIVDEKYVIGTVRIPEGKKIGHFFITREGRTSTELSKSRYSFPLKSGGKDVIFIDTKTGSIKTSLSGLDLSGVYYGGPADKPSGQGFWSWVGNLINDIASGIAAHLTLISGDEGTFKYSDGGTTEVEHGTMTYDNGRSGFIAEPGLEGQPGVWY